MQIFKSTRHTALAVVIALSGLAVFGSKAAAHDVATRCDWRGCVRIVCENDGNRCYRDDDRYRESYDGRYRDGYNRYREGYYDRESEYQPRRGWRYDCDADADNCHVQREHHYDYDHWRE
jgi:hypothetical protein